MFQRVIVLMQRCASLVVAAFAATIQLIASSPSAEAQTATLHKCSDTDCDRFVLADTWPSDFVRPTVTRPPVVLDRVVARHLALVDDVSVDVSTVPEPASAGLLAVGLVALGGVSARRRATRHGSPRTRPTIVPTPPVADRALRGL